MRTLHIPLEQQLDPFMATVASNDHLNTNEPHSDIAMLVNSLTQSTQHDSTSSHSKDGSRPASTNPSQNSQPQNPTVISPPNPSQAQVQQQAQMTLQSLLATAHRKANGGQDSSWPLNNVTQNQTVDPRPNGQPSSSKRRLEDPDEEESHAKIRRTVQEHVQQENDRIMNMTTVVCLHAAVAQKSYGSEKRFLCPPPLVRIEGPFGAIREQKLAMSVVSETGERAPEAIVPLDSSMTASFKFLHVSGTAKAKSFNLSLEISAAPHPSPEGQMIRPKPWATFESAPVTIISKPSKKTAKTRNISSCILAGGPVSLFNRINSQTVRTKYMTIDNAHLCASNVSWSAFNVNVVRRPQDVAPVGGPQPVTYGSEIILMDSMTGIATAPLVIRKVDKGKISNEEGGPVSQMQKIALQRVNPDGTRHYLSAAGPVPGTPGVVAPPAPGAASQAGTHQLMFQSPRIREEVKDGVRSIHDEVDDYLCWTIVGISKFQYTFFDALGQNNKIPENPITPFPTLFQPPIYRPANNTLEITVSSFFYENPKTGHHSQLEIWLGDIGPLTHRICNAPPSGPLTNIAPFYGPTEGGSQPPGSPMSPTSGSAGAPAPMLPPAQYIAPGPFHTNLMVDMPPINQIVKALQDEVRRQEAAAKGESVEQRSPPEEPVNIAGRSLPLLFIRGADGIGYHSGRTITCENLFQGMDLNNPVGGGGDPQWIQAAQAAAAANAGDNGIHGWSIRVL